LADWVLQSWTVELREDLRLDEMTAKEKRILECACASGPRENSPWRGLYATLQVLARADSATHCCPLPDNGNPLLEHGTEDMTGLVYPLYIWICVSGKDHKL
jgi:hypothetical protein